MEVTELPLNLAQGVPEFSMSNEVRSAVALSVLAVVSEPRSQPVGGMRLRSPLALFLRRPALDYRAHDSRRGRVKGRHPVQSVSASRVRP